MRNGIFWLIDEKLLCFKDGTFNHKRSWLELPNKITGGLPYNYYPRGRVEIKREKAVIYMNRHIYTEQVIIEIKREFELHTVEVVIKIDGSKHYRCCLDDGWNHYN